MGNEIATGEGITPPELEEDNVKPATRLLIGSSPVPEEVGFFVV